MKAWSVGCLVMLLGACGDDSTSNANDGGVSNDGSAAAEDSATAGACGLIDDTGGPGQYSDRCVKREWIADYAGTYESAMCTLEIDITGDVPAVFTIIVKSGELAGTYTNDWEGGTGAGNDSYYRFTSDATFTTTTTLNFNAGHAVDSNGEDAIVLRVENIDTTPTFTGRYDISTFAPQDYKSAECGVLTKQ